MKTEIDMFVQAYGVYLHQEKDLSFGTIETYKEKAQAYFNDDMEEFDSKPPYMVEAEMKMRDLIGGETGIKN